MICRKVGRTPLCCHIRFLMDILSFHLRYPKPQDSFYVLKRSIIIIFLINESISSFNWPTAFQLQKCTYFSTIFYLNHQCVKYKRRRFESHPLWCAPLVKPCAGEERQWAPCLLQIHHLWAAGWLHLLFYPVPACLSWPLSMSCLLSKDACNCTIFPI